MSCHTSILEKGTRALCGDSSYLATWRESCWVTCNSWSLLPLHATTSTGWGYRQREIFLLYWIVGQNTQPLQWPFCEGPVPELLPFCRSSICWPNTRHPLPHPHPALLYPIKEEGGWCSILHLGSLCYFGYSLCFPCLFLSERMPAVRDPPLPSERSACQLQASACSQQLSEDSQTSFLSLFTGQEGSWAGRMTQ